MHSVICIPKREYSRWHQNKKKEVVSATRIDHAIVSEHLLDCLVETKYVPVGFSDHNLLLVYINREPETCSSSNDYASRTTVLILETSESNEPMEGTLIGPGVWKLYHGAFTERQFCQQMLMVTNLS